MYNIVAFPAFRLDPPEEEGAAGTVVNLGHMNLIPSPLRPSCPADQRMFRWRGVNTPPPSVLPIPVIQRLADIAAHASLKDPASIGSGLRKFHIFCDIFSIPETDRLPASLPLLRSFALWAAADPDPADPTLCDGTVFEPVSAKTASKYLSAVKAWHYAQGWPEPYSDSDLDSIHRDLRGLARLQEGRRSRPPRPPINLRMLNTLYSSLDLSVPFDACVWAAATCAFWGMMRFGETTVRSRRAFSPSLHPTRANAISGTDSKGKEFVRIDLPSAKTAQPGEIQHVYLLRRDDHLCPIAALENLSRVVPAGPDAPLFSWRDSHGDVRPLIRATALTRINTILSDNGWGTMFGHSFRIGGASYYLAQGINPEIVRLAGRWRSLAYEAYIRAFEEVVSVHMGGM